MAIKMSIQLAYENHEHNEIHQTFLASKKLSDSSALASGMDLRNISAVNPTYAHVTHDARLIKLMNENIGRHSLPLGLNLSILTSDS
eukprot:13303895-Ditylum_brightwellii.AAC.1